MGREDRRIAAQHHRPIAPPGWFVPEQEVVVAQAPGRLDVMGGIADYSGATVLELPLALRATRGGAACDRRAAGRCTGGPATGELARASILIPIAALLDGPPEAAPERLRAALLDAGAALGRLRARPAGDAPGHRDACPTIPGLRLAVWSDVPAGAGVSSSAALEVAGLRALQALFGIELEPLRGRTLAQQAEHRVALAPVRDHGSGGHAVRRRDQLLMLRCQPAERAGPPHASRDGVQVLGIDSGVAHRVGGGQYGARARRPRSWAAPSSPRIDPADPPGGYLCNLDARAVRGAL